MYRYAHIKDGKVIGIYQLSGEVNRSDYIRISPDLPVNDGDEYDSASSSFTPPTTATE